MPIGHELVVSDWSNTGTTLGAAGFVGIVAMGSAGATTITIKDGTTTKYAPVIATTQLLGFLFTYKPVGFTNMIITVSGTGSYSITYYPRTYGTG